jgi:hypothetical protein
MKISFLIGFLAYFFKEILRKLFSDHWDAIFVWRVFPWCEHCKSICHLKLEGSRTLYNFDGNWCDPKNPNRPLFLCRRCAEDHHNHWDEMWSDYHSGLL